MAGPSLAKARPRMRVAAVRLVRILALGETRRHHLARARDLLSDNDSFVGHAICGAVEVWRKDVAESDCCMACHVRACAMRAEIAG